MILNIFLVVFAYLLGSIPSAVWIGRRFYGVDVREHGSHNAGATNTLRVLGRKAALPVFAIDVFKGFCAVMLAHLSSYETGSNQMFNLMIVLVAAAVIGHMLPIFAGFKGGKGVATIAGATLALCPVGLLLAFMVFIVVFFVWHYVSLGSICAGIFFPVYVLCLDTQVLSLVIYSVVIALMLIFTHRKNIKRLVIGNESKIYLFGSKSK